jgi:hypothetical protein
MKFKNEFDTEGDEQSSEPKISPKQIEALKKLKENEKQGFR